MCIRDREYEVAQRWEQERNNIKKKDEEHEMLRDEFMKITELKRSIENKIRENETKYENELYDSSNQVKELNRQLDVLKQELKDTYNRLQVAKKEKNEMDTKIYQYAQSMERLEKDNKELELQLHEAEQLLARREQETSQIQYQREQHNKTAKEYEEKLFIASKELDKVSAEKNMMAKKHSEDTAKYKEIIESEKRRYKEYMLELEKANTKLKEELKTVMKNMNNFKAMCSQLEEEKSNRGDEAIALKKELSEITIESDRKMLQLKKDHEIAIDSLKADYKELEVTSKCYCRENWSCNTERKCRR
eukprot:TRINITY_DN2960_c0_g2_i10.p1 TRINITY_DN2960_c0_g2~~TRINITY_DN2960_c0_g2_i10.p1  ORF type:complete len:305 (-),score=112.09 TRINITY_DN2960_c0_g2_i10:353-1267(-)